MTTPDRQRRIVPVACVTREGAPDGVHLSLLSWLPQWEAWATGPALCGRSAEQGALPEGTPVTCTGFDGSCESYRDSYQRAIDGRPTAHEEEVTQLRAEVDRHVNANLAAAERAQREIESLRAEVEAVHQARLNEPILRHCLYPGCLREFDVNAALCGRTPERPAWSSEGWVQVKQLDGHMCPTHRDVVVTGGAPGPHLPAWDYGRDGAPSHLRCPCGWASPPVRWRRYATEAWKEHILTAVEATDTVDPA